jgi:hypothetical protein
MDGEKRCKIQVLAAFSDGSLMIKEKIMPKAAETIENRGYRP